MYILVPFIVFTVTLLVMVVVLSLYFEYEEHKTKERCKRFANNHLFIGTPEQLARLREWGEQNNRD